MQAGLRHLLPLSFLRTFTRHQLASLGATILDYLCLFSMTEIIHIHYTIATAVGALLGAVSNFLMNRYWSFQAHHEKWTTQSSRYLLVSAGSLILNTAGVYGLTESLGWHYALSVGVTSLIVGIFFNFPLHKYYVYETSLSSRPAATSLL